MAFHAPLRTMTTVLIH